jgi:hypothetical protein
MRTWGKIYLFLKMFFCLLQVVLSFSQTLNSLVKYLSSQHQGTNFQFSVGVTGDMLLGF